MWGALHLLGPSCGDGADGADGAAAMGGHLWGGDRMTPGGLSEGEQNTARGYFAKLQIPGLILVLVGIGGGGHVIWFLTSPLVTLLQYRK